MPDFTLLSRSPIFGGVPPERILQLLGQVETRIRKFGRDEVIAIMGQPVDSLMIVNKGSVRGEMMDYSGHTLKIEDIEAPRPLASGFLFGRGNRFPVTVIANEPAEILIIPLSSFLRLMQLDRQVLTNYLDTISSRTQFLSQKLFFLSFRTIREKVAHFLLQQAGSRLHSIELKQSRQQLADLFGVTRPALSRVFGEMEREGLIRTEKKIVMILDKERLNTLLKNE